VLTREKARGAEYLRGFATGECIRNEDALIQNPYAGI
jgi:hypothetical protein